MKPSIYQIKLPQFEGPFDLLLFFIERDELDIYNIPITQITKDFLEYLHHQRSLNIELSSEFILFISTLMRIKAKMLLPRKELDEKGNEIDPRQELVDKILEYKRFKEAAIELAEKETLRQLMQKRGNLIAELSKIGEDAAEGTEIQNINLFKIMKTFEKVMQRVIDRNHKPVHTVVHYNWTMEGSREYILTTVKKSHSMSFESIFNVCEDRIHALFLFLSLLELSQMRFMTLQVGEGKNNFIVEWNDNRDEELAISPIPENTLSEDDPNSVASAAKGEAGSIKSAIDEADAIFPDQPPPSAN